MFSFRRQLHSGAPMTPSRPPIVKDIVYEAHPVSTTESYIAAQLELAVQVLAPFTKDPACPKCQSAALTTEYGTQWYIPSHPDDLNTLRESLSFADYGKYVEGPEFLIRTCTNCKYVWGEHAAQ